MMETESELRTDQGSTSAEHTERAVGKRQKKDTHGRFAALRRLKELQDTRSKHKYEVTEVDNVYDVVSHEEYSKRVQERLESNAFVNDDGMYFDDGREIFDEDDDKERMEKIEKKKRGTKRGKREDANLDEEDDSKAANKKRAKTSLKAMFSNMSSSSRKTEQKVVDDDDVLSEIINEIDDPSSKTTPRSKAKKGFSLIAEKKAAQQYMSSFTQKKVEIVKITHPEEVVKEEPIETDVSPTETATEKSEETAPAPIQKVLFTVKKKVVAPTPEPVAVIDEFADIDFDDDFGDFDSTAGEREHSDVTEKQLSEGLTFSDTQSQVEDVDAADIHPELANSNNFKFFWWDAYEPENNDGGNVLLFGKTYKEAQKAFVSCCVAIKNVLRKVYLLPRPFFLDDSGNETERAVSIKDVYEEFNTEVAKAFKMKSYKCKKVTKKYAFDASVPVESEYLEVRYDGNYKFHERRYKTFSRVFGMTSSILEIFLLERQIKGPCWLVVSNSEVANNPYTYTSVEVRCEKPADVALLECVGPLPPPPPLVILTLNIKASDQDNQIALISCLVKRNYRIDKQAPARSFDEHFCVLTRLTETPFPQNTHLALCKYQETKVHRVDSEKGLFNTFVKQFERIDPDVIVGHDLIGYQLNILSDRAGRKPEKDIRTLSRLRGRGKRTQFNMFAGRLMCDVKQSAKELIRSRSYDLDALCQLVLKQPAGQRVEIEPEHVPLMYASTSELFRFISLTMRDTAYALRLMFELNVLPLALQITNIAGNVMSRTLMGGRSERNEWLLLHAFDERQYIVPDKINRKKISSSQGEQHPSRKKATYTGGLVLDPKVGFYDKLILLMDFNSLYPSIIQEYNICFTTIPDAGEETAVAELQLPGKDVPAGILPTEIRKLVESRREVKKLMKAPDLGADLQQQYNIRQTALKLTANSMYGCLGFGNSRFFAKRLAALVTQKGREILTATQDAVQRLSYDVIYGDTDSIMINTNITDYDQVFRIGKSIKAEINQMYKQVELDIDGVFKYLLLLKKKKYAAVVLTRGKGGALEEVQEHKGLDIVRRDWSQVAAEAGKFVLNQILCDQPEDDRVENIMAQLRKLKEDLEADAVPHSLLVVTKQLTKQPEQYSKGGANNANAQQSHVMVALRHNRKRGGKKFHAGDTVPYVICTAGTSNAATQRAYLLEEMKNDATLRIDTGYYLGQQIYPVVMRICEPIESIDAHELAACLGVDARFVRKPAGNASQQNAYNCSDIQRIATLTRYSKPFVFRCLACGSENTLDDKSDEYALEACINADCNVRPVEYVNFIKNQLLLALRGYAAKYNRNEFTCEDPMCTVNTVGMPQLFAGGNPVCPQCHEAVIYKAYREADVYAQLVYLQRLFDIAKKSKRDVESLVASAYATLKETVDKYLAVCGYANVDLTEIFAAFTMNRAVKIESDCCIDATQVFDEV